MRCLLSQSGSILIEFKCNLGTETCEVHMICFFLLTSSWVSCKVNQYFPPNISALDMNIYFIHSIVLKHSNATSALCKRDEVGPVGPVIQAGAPTEFRVPQKHFWVSFHFRSKP